MSETDSFIEEVTEEVRRDKLFAVMRKYGWIGVVGVLAIVGGATYNEFSKSQKTARSQAFGDSVLNAVDQSDAAARITALGAITAPTKDGTVVVSLLEAAEAATKGDVAASTTVLSKVSNTADVSAQYRDLAFFKQLIRTGEGALSTEERRLGLDELAAPGNPLRLLAEEQIALIDLADANPEAAISRLSAILEDADLTQGLRQRVTQLMIALGQDPAAAQ